VPTVAANRTKIKILYAKPLSQLSWLVHGFSSRPGGFSRVYGKSDLNLGFTKDDSEAAVQRNREAFLRALGEPGEASAQARRDADTRSWNLISVRQVHSDVIRHFDSACWLSPPALSLAGDGLITATPGLLLAVQTADCFPIILADVRHRAVGVFHAGWRGTVIQGCCYDVGEEVRTKFESQFADAAKLFREVKDSDPVREKYPLLFLTARAPGHSHLPKRLFLDLVEANRRQLLAAGIAAHNIEVSRLCTSCRPDLLFSYRAEKGRTGRMMSVVGIRP
jgi:copper oxidase (laccase) domain-containing protein